MSQRLPVDEFDWKKTKFKFNEKFVRNYDKEKDKG